LVCLFVCLVLLELHHMTINYCIHVLSNASKGGQNHNSHLARCTWVQHQFSCPTCCARRTWSGPSAPCMEDCLYSQVVLLFFIA
jgi:hypothetical protein